MPRLMAIEWDASEIRALVARSRGRELVIEEAFAAPLVARDESGAVPKVGTQLAAIVQRHGLSKLDVQVAVARGSIELRQLSLPPCPPDELPDMVRFQALRQFATISEDWPVDYLPLDSGDGDSVNVLAAAIAPEMVKQIQQICDEAHLRMTRLALRPVAAAALIRHRASGSDGCRMTVDLLTDEADLTVMVNHQVVFLRTVRLPNTSEIDVQNRALLGEIRRTMVAAQNQLRGQAVQQITLFGDGSDQSALKTLLEESIALPVDLFDPFSGLELAPSLQRAKPEHLGRFAPLLGMLIEQAQETKEGIDFLHPRERPKPKSNRRMSVLLTATAATFVLGVISLVWMQQMSLDDEISRLRGEVAKLNRSMKTAEKQKADTALVDQFLAGDITWLDEIYELAKRLPPAKETILTQFSAERRNPAGGLMVLEGNVAKSSLIDSMERELRKANYRVLPSYSRFDDRNKDYPWQVKETILVEPESVAATTRPGADGSETSTGGGKTAEGDKTGASASTKPAEPAKTSEVAKSSEPSKTQDASETSESPNESDAAKASDPKVSDSAEDDSSTKTAEPTKSAEPAANSPSGNSGDATKPSAEKVEPAPASEEKADGGAKGKAESANAETNAEQKPESEKSKQVEAGSTPAPADEKQSDAATAGGSQRGPKS